MTGTDTEFVDAWANVVFFLLHAEQDRANMMYGGIKVREAVDSLAVLLNKDPEQLRGLIK